jgi:UMF1 family MFS transporter
VFALITFATLRNRPPREAGGGVKESLGQLFRTLRGMASYPQTLTFLIAYLLYNDAVQAVITLAGQFGIDELKMSMESLSLAILMVQFVAFGGALIFKFVARAVGAKAAIVVSLAIWGGVLISVYVSVRTSAQFFVMAAIVAIVLGGTQALSRSLFSQMIPRGREAEYFGVYEVSDKGTSWMAPLFFGLTLQLTRSYRLAIVSLIVFILAGMLVLLRVNVARAAAEAGRDPLDAQHA